MGEHLLLGHKPVQAYILLALIKDANKHLEGRILTAWLQGRAGNGGGLCTSCKMWTLARPSNCTSGIATPGGSCSPRPVSHLLNEKRNQRSATQAALTHPILVPRKERKEMEGVELGGGRTRACRWREALSLARCNYLTAVLGITLLTFIFMD